MMLGWDVYKAVMEASRNAQEKNGGKEFAGK